MTLEQSGNVGEFVGSTAVPASDRSTDHEYYEASFILSVRANYTQWKALGRLEGPRPTPLAAMEKIVRENGAQDPFAASRGDIN